MHAIIKVATCRPAGAGDRGGAKDRPIITRLNLGTTLHINTIIIVTGIPAPAFNGNIAARGGDIHPGTTDFHANKSTCLLNAIIGIQHDIAGGGGKICGDFNIATQKGQVACGPTDGTGNRYCTREKSIVPPNHQRARGDTIQFRIGEG